MELIEYEISNLKSILVKTNDNSKRDRQLTLKDKEKIIWRLVYISLMGYEIDFGWFEILELASSDISEYKQCGYVAASTIYKQNVELLRLLINTIKSDLNNCFEVLINNEEFLYKSRNFRPFSVEIGKNYSGKSFDVRKQRIKNCLLALNFIGNVPTLDFADNLFIDVKKIAELPLEKQLNDTNIVRSKAICCLTKLFQCCPDRLRAYEWGERLVTYFQFERNCDCLISQCIFIRNSLKYYLGNDYFEPKENSERNLTEQEADNSKIDSEREIMDSNFSIELIKSWELIVPTLIFTLSRIRSNREIKHWKFHKIPLFWLQVKLIEILQLLPQVNNDRFVNYKMNKIMEEVFFSAIQATKSINESNSNISSTSDEIEFQCVIGIAVEMTKYISKTSSNQEFPVNIGHLMGTFIEGLLYTENKDYISISISLIFDFKTNRVIEELIKKNMVVLLRFICSIDEDTTLNLLNIFSHICSKNNWIFITKEILNGVLYKYILNTNKLNNKDTPSIQRCSNDYFYPGKAKTLLEEIILSVCYTIRRFSNISGVSLKTINILFQLLEKSMCDLNPVFEITENTLFQIIDILFDSKLKNERLDMIEKTNEPLKYDSSIQKYVTIKSYKLLYKLGKYRNNFNPKSGIRWLCFILGEYGQLISNKISIIQQVEVLLNIHDVLTIDSDEEQIPLIKSTILLSFTKLYCNSDHDTQNQIYEILKIGVRNRGNSIDSPEFLNAIIANTQYSITPTNGNLTPVERLSNNNSCLRYRNQLLNGVFVQRKNSFLVSSQLNKYGDDGYCNRNTWLSLCLLNKGSLYNFSLLSIGFSNGNFKYSSGESTIIIKLENKKKNKTFRVERISTISEEKKVTKNSNSFSNIFDSTCQNLHVEISGETNNKDLDNEGTFEQRINLICKGPYLNPPMVSLLLRIFSNSKDEVLDLNEKIEEIDTENNYSKLICVNFRLPVILSNFMAPTKKMEKNEFEHFWGKLTQSSVKGVLAISYFEIPIYLQLLNFCIYSTIDEVNNSNLSNSMTYSGTSTLYLSNRKRIPCMLKVMPCENTYSESRAESKVHEDRSNEKSVEIRVRSSSLIVAKILKQIVSTYIIANSN
ncbi:adapter-related protein complex 2 alpha 1 subunit [Cryptosporidium ubiquitum]|uniref:Adapter-related protein complex 2 alpha 1 subunit n=1 Tax=Cryptosporidium ubiquitum TaxID=857276 RepID=A0A1J4MJA3_9CRYT|nr:adapter-related protein complex 2 alpha 1 subunit [Cryptosporidium ubiquitum]OII73100.1 adapter-related protein complex 2 alpha 1 subunit [Cryptosporidium ubiquitum]